MQILLNIQDFSRPIVFETRKASLVTVQAGFLKRFLSFFLIPIRKRIDKSLGRLIIALEGFIPHIEDLSNENLEKELSVIIKASREIFKANDKIAAINYFGDPEIKEKYIHVIKLINTTENKLHKAVYKNKPIVKTPIEIIEGVARMNRNNLDKLLSV